MKLLKRQVNPTSKHLQFWSDAVAELNWMYFQKDGTYEKRIPSSLKFFRLIIQKNNPLFKKIHDMSKALLTSNVLNNKKIP